MTFASARPGHSHHQPRLARAFAHGAVVLLLVAGPSACVRRTTGRRVPSPSVLMLEAGARIRVFAAPFGTSPRIGFFTAAHGETLSMRAENTLDSLAVPFSAIRQLDVNTWHGSRTSRGALAGAAAGFGAGALIASGCKSGDAGCSEWSQRLPMALAGAAVGAGAGALVGHALSRDQWVAVSLPTSRR